MWNDSDGQRVTVRPALACARGPSVLVFILALALGCNRGKDWCGPCEPGYGTVHVTTRFTDDYTESVNAEYGAQMQFIIEQSEDGFESCSYYGDPYNIIDGQTTSLDFTATYAVPEGWVCGSTVGAGGSDSDGISYDCSGGFGPTRVRECACVEARLDVTCEETWDEGD